VFERSGWWAVSPAIPRIRRTGRRRSVSLCSLSQSQPDCACGARSLVLTLTEDSNAIDNPVREPPRGARLFPSSCSPLWQAPSITNRPTSFPTSRGWLRSPTRNLKNPWGLTRSATSPWWVANNNSGHVDSLYRGLASSSPINGTGNSSCSAPWIRAECAVRSNRSGLQRKPDGLPGCTGGGGAFHLRHRGRHDLGLGRRERARCS